MSLRLPVLFDAILSLRPNAKFATYGEDYSTVVWFEGENNKPTLQEVTTELARLNSEYNLSEYQRLRLPKYPTVNEQLDMLWHAIDNGTLNKTSDFYTAIKAVKDAHPKE